MARAKPAQVSGNRYQMFVNGEWVDSENEEKINVVNPATEKVIAFVPKASREQTKSALEAAEKAQLKWEDLAPVQRASFLHQTAQLIRRDKERLARILTSEQGKPLFEARGEIDGAASNFEYYAEFARRIEGDVLPSDNPRQTVMILRLPIGVVASITPWNFPSATVARKLAPALITGNTVVTKPSSNTPLSTIEMVRLMEEAGFPKGVVNVVTGSGSEVGDELVTNKITGLVTLTGSTDAGRAIMEHASNHLPKLVLELGGKAPFIVWHDADIPWALKCAIWARFWNCGQTCICSERMYVDEKIKDKFVPAFVRMANDLQIGNPLESDTDLGPMVSKQERDTSMSFIEKAKEEGDRIVIGGEKPTARKPRWFREPTVIEGVKQKSSLVQDEIFGPVVPILEVDSYDKAVEYANDSKYRLATYIFTKDSTRVLKAMNRIKFGQYTINSV